MGSTLLSSQSNDEWYFEDDEFAQKFSWRKVKNMHILDLHMDDLYICLIQRILKDKVYFFLVIEEGNKNRVQEGLIRLIGFSVYLRDKRWFLS